MPNFSAETATVSTTSSSGSVGRSAGRGSITVLQNEPRAGDRPGAISRSRERGRYPRRGFKLKREQRATSPPFEIKGAVPESPRFLFDTLVGAAAPSARYARTADSIRQRGPGRDGAARGGGPETPCSPLCTGRQATPRHPHRRPAQIVQTILFRDLASHPPTTDWWRHNTEWTVPSEHDAVTFLRRRQPPADRGPPTA
jgi:hypothetical protein